MPLATGFDITSHKYTILIAVDNEANMLLAVTMPGRILHNAKLIRRKNGLEALLSSKKSWQDLILIDVQMPEMNGLEATERIRLMQAWQRMCLSSP